MLILNFYLGRKDVKCQKSNNSSEGSSTISTTEIKEVIEQLKMEKYRKSKQRNYYSVWKVFNEFYMQLDRKPGSWEDRITLFAAYLIRENRKSTTVKSYISAIKAVLADINVTVNEDTYLLNSLTHACRLTRDSYSIRMPIPRELLNVILNRTYKYHLNNGQSYIAQLYVTLFLTAYYGLFRVGELTESEHVIKACNVFIGTNKNKIKFILRSSKTHGEYTSPQIVKISSSTTVSSQLCPFQILQSYVARRPEALNNQENFFIFGDRSPVYPYHFCKMLKQMLHEAGFDSTAYLTHSLRSGRSLDLLNLGLAIEVIKRLGRWKSNAVYAYLKQ